MPRAKSVEVEMGPEHEWASQAGMMGLALEHAGGGGEYLLFVCVLERDCADIVFFFLHVF